MEKFLTPRQVARALDVSQSSLKRWCDRGLIASIRTAGGHRRIPLDALFAYLRRGEHRLVNPEVLGLPSNTGQGDRVVARAQRQLADALAEGRRGVCRQILFDLYLAGHRISVIADRAISPAMAEIGVRWECGSLEVFRERRACNLLLDVLHDFEATLSDPPPEAPVAIGGTFGDDPYMLPTKVSELVLRQAGWRATSLGTGLPAETLQAAIRELLPRLFWLSVSHIESPQAFLDQYHVLQAAAAESSTALVVGGNALSEAMRRDMRYSAYCDKMQHLETFADSLTGHTNGYLAPETNGASEHDN